MNVPILTCIELHTSGSTIMTTIETAIWACG